MARPLPFEVQPTVRYHEIGDEESGRGVLKFKKRGTLSINERREIAEADKSAELFEVIARFCVRIHQEAEATSVIAEKELVDVYLATRRILQAMRESSLPALNDIETEIALRFPSELQSFKRSDLANDEAVIIRQATVMIRSRLRDCEDWTDEDTRQLDSEKLIVEIASFCRDEANGGAVSAVVDVAKQLEELQEALGKLQTKAGSLLQSPTGEPSTGDADSPSPALPSSPPSDSETSTPSTPSRRSKPPMPGRKGASTTKALASPN